MSPSGSSEVINNGEEVLMAIMSLSVIRPPCVNMDQFKSCCSRDTASRKSLSVLFSFGIYITNKMLHFIMSNVKVMYKE